MDDTIDTLTSFCRKNKRVCPEPYLWNQLWELLLNRQQQGNGRRPGPPLILAAWHETSDFRKMQRLREHIEWAERGGVLAEVGCFFREIPEHEWHHIGE